MKQYPHFLFRKEAEGDTVQDPTTGEWIDKPSEWIFHGECREEPNGKGSVVNGEDGQATVYASTVYLPFGTTRIQAGVEIFVSDTNSVSSRRRVSGRVLRFSDGQLNCRLWV
jgi:hypothetical protein